MGSQADAKASSAVVGTLLRAPTKEASRVFGRLAHRLTPSAWFLLLFFTWSRVGATGLLLSEILFNPEGSDRRAEYIEIRGTPNQRISLGTCLIAVDGDAESNPGTVMNVIDLSNVAVGGNGFIVLLQSESLYVADSGATLLTNAAAAGWGSGSRSSIGHLGHKGIVELENASVTFLLARTTRWTTPGDDLDANNDGILDQNVVSGWEHLDSIGILDADGVGDIAYGKVNFRRREAPGNSAFASGSIVPLDFTPGYVGRRANSTAFEGSSWAAAGNLLGTPPAWRFGSAGDCWPASFSGKVLDHLGAPNFGASALPGVVVEPAAGLSIRNDGTVTNLSVRLSATPNGPVKLEITSSGVVELSTNGVDFSSAVTALLTDGTPRSVFLKTSDETVGVGPNKVFVTGSVVSSGDIAQYPLTALVPSLPVIVLDGNFVLLNEAKVNPPGTNDGPFEFVEILGTPGAVLRDIWLAVIDGKNTPGTVTYLRPLGGVRLGTNGLLLIGAPDSPYTLPPHTTFVPEPLFHGRGALQNSDASILLLSTRTVLMVGMDLDANDDGRMEALPEDALVLDSIGWCESADDLVYGSARIIKSAAPDAFGRVPGNLASNELDAWFYGDLTEGDPAVATFEPATTSEQFPPGVFLTPGAVTRLPPNILAPAAISGVIGDPTNPEVPLALAGPTNTPSVWKWAARSTNQAVLPDANIALSSTAGGASLRLTPIGVGYSRILIFVSDGTVSNSESLLYAASQPERSAGAWHLGASDGSTAVALDGDFMLVGDDENQGIRLYPRNRSSLPLAQYDFTDALQLPDVGPGVPREVDIEASTRTGNRIFWIGSHGHSSFGEIRTNRTRLFATDLHDSGTAATLIFTGHYDYLKVDLLRWDALNLHGKGTNYYGLEASDAEGVPPKAPDGSGLAIEGLAMLPRNTNAAYVAFRAPIVPASERTRALLVPVMNLASLASQGGSPGSAHFGLPVELDLGGRGVRSIEYNDGGYLIVAGPPGVGQSSLPSDFRLFTWSGNEDEGAREFSADLTGLNPEGIVELPASPWTEQSRVNLLSDSGSTEYYADGVSAKLLPIPNFKKCRSDWVELGKVVSRGPVVTLAGIFGTRVRLRWAAHEALTYVVEVCDSLETPGWERWAGPITAEGAFAEVELPLEGAQRFMRLLVMDGGR